MLDPYAAVIVTDLGLEPAYVVIGHNLAKWDGERLAERLTSQDGLDAHVIYHRNRHELSQATACDVCQLLVEEIIENAGKMVRSREANRV